jgi:hypothetical protein
MRDIIVEYKGHERNWASFERLSVSLVTRRYICAGDGGLNRCATAGSTHRSRGSLFGYTQRSDHLDTLHRPSLGFHRYSGEESGLHLQV